MQSHAVRAEGGAAAGKVTVKACRLDDVVPQERTSPVAAMKIDIEGFEMEALAGAEAYLARPNVIVILRAERQDASQSGRQRRRADPSFPPARLLLTHHRRRASERHDPAWPEYKNGIFYRGDEATRRVDAALRSPGN